jgi:hypothetical protein
MMIGTAIVEFSPFGSRNQAVKFIEPVMVSPVGREILFAWPILFGSAPGVIRTVARPA